MTWAVAFEWLKGQPAGKGRDFLYRLASRKAVKAASKPKRPKGGAGSVKSLTHKLDEIFSRFIRMRDRLPGTQICKCITCGKVDEWKNMDCGHFMSRGFMATRWYEWNCAAQCRKCNRFQEGLHHDFALAIDKLHGTGVSGKLMAAAKSGKRKWMPFELEAMIKMYQEKVTGMECS